jgi:hypothetical protein
MTFTKLQLAKFALSCKGLTWQTDIGSAAREHGTQPQQQTGLPHQVGLAVHLRLLLPMLLFLMLTLEEALFYLVKM